jgi:SPP1 gp7 family putative phage head morphogenesis protein
MSQTALSTPQLRANFRKAQARFQKSRRAEIDYARKLRSIARQVGVIVSGFAPDGVVHDQPMLVGALNRYAEMITPWAKAVASRMLYDIQRRDETMWKEMGDEIGRNLKREIENAPLGLAMKRALDDQVALITSLPREAARRVQDITMLMLSDSTRASELRDEIMRTGEVTKSRANLIARTEVARTACALTTIRAQQAGLTHYTWVSAGDSDVRSSHKHMNGKICSFANPPEVEPGKFYHPGETFNCRCFQMPIVPEVEA